jgi:hypothetical protein
MQFELTHGSLGNADLTRQYCQETLARRGHAAASMLNIDIVSCDTARVVLKVLQHLDVTTLDEESREAVRGALVAMQNAC